MSAFAQKTTIYTVCTAVLALGSLLARGQNTSNDVPPVLDVHVHAMDESFPGWPHVPEHFEVHGLRSGTKEARSAG